MRIDHREVQLTFHRDGCAGVALLVDEGVSRFVLRKALRMLLLKGGDAAPGLSDLVDMFKVRGIVSERTGPTKPDAGDRRRYKVQEVEGSRFLRLPVNHFGDDCDECEAEFFVGNIKVTPCD